MARKKTATEVVIGVFMTLPVDEAKVLLQTAATVLKHREGPAVVKTRKTRAIADAA